MWLTPPISAPSFRKTPKTRLRPLFFNNLFSHYRHHIVIYSSSLPLSFFFPFCISLISNTSMCHHIDTHTHTQTQRVIMSRLKHSSPLKTPLSGLQFIQYHCANILQCCSFSAASRLSLLVLLMCWALVCVAEQKRYTHTDTHMYFYLMTPRLLIIWLFEKIVCYHLAKYIWLTISFLLGLKTCCIYFFIFI